MNKFIYLKLLLTEIIIYLSLFILILIALDYITGKYMWGLIFFVLYYVKVREKVKKILNHKKSIFFIFLTFMFIFIINFLFLEFFLLITLNVKDCIFLLLSLIAIYLSNEYIDYNKYRGKSSS